jgi:hypothetical protein
MRCAFILPGRRKGDRHGVTSSDGGLLAAYAVHA